MSLTPTPGPDYTGYIHEPTVYSIGDRFPFENPRPGSEGGALITHTGFFGIGFWSSNPQTDRPTFENELAMCALWESSSFLHFLVLHFPSTGLTCDMFFNPLRMNTDGRELWQRADTQYIMLYLIDERTNVLLAWRPLRVPPPMARRIQVSAEFHWSNDCDGRADELNRRAELIMSTRTGERLLVESRYQNGPDWQSYCAFSQPNISTPHEKEQQ